MSEIVVDPLEIESRRRERTWRLAAVELPLIRVAGSVLLSLGIYVNNRYLVPTAIEGWLISTIVIAAYALVSWLLIVVFLRRDPPVDLTLPALVGDIPLWAFAIYHSGAEESWLFFILLLRVADQVQTTFRRAVATSLVIITLTGIAALSSHLLTGAAPNWGITAALGCCTALGALGGTAIADRLPQAALAKVFAVIVALLALFLLADATLLGGPPT